MRLRRSLPRSGSVASTSPLFPFATYRGARARYPYILMRRGGVRGVHGRRAGVGHAAAGSVVEPVLSGGRRRCRRHAPGVVGAFSGSRPGGPVRWRHVWCRHRGLVQLRLECRRVRGAWASRAGMRSPARCASTAPTVARTARIPAVSIAQRWGTGPGSARARSVPSTTPARMAGAPWPAAVRASGPRRRVSAGSSIATRRSVVSSSGPTRVAIISSGVRSIFANSGST